MQKEVHETRVSENIQKKLIDKYNSNFVHAFFTTMFVGGVDELLREMQKSFPELGLVKDDCNEMSWIESILFFAGFPRNTSLDVLLDWNNSATNQKYFFKGKSDYVQRPISINGLEGIWKLFNQVGENSAEIQFSPYGGKLSDISESETPFPHRAGNIFMIHYAVFSGGMENSQSNIAWIRKLYGYMAKYVSKSPRVAYLNYRDLDLGVNNKGNYTSYAQARIWGVNISRTTLIGWSKSRQKLIQQISLEMNKVFHLLVVINKCTLQ